MDGRVFDDVHQLHLLPFFQRRLAAVLTDLADCTRSRAVLKSRSNF